MLYYINSYTSTDPLDSMGPVVSVVILLLKNGLIILYLILVIKHYLLNFQEVILIINQTYCILWSLI